MGHLSKSELDGALRPPCYRDLRALGSMADTLSFPDNSNYPVSFGTRVRTCGPDPPEYAA